MNESQQFVEEFEKKNDDPFAFLENPESEKTVEVEKPAEEPTDPEPRNRRERRLMEKLQSERESGIALAAKLDAITQSQQSRTEQAQYLDVAERIYGTQTPELREATELLKTALSGVKEEAKREALAEWQTLRQTEQQAIASAEKRIDMILEEIEDEKNVDLTEGPHRTGFLKLLEKMSPKDSNGNVLDYADHIAVWEVYQSQIKKPVNPAKDMAARGMTQGGGTAPSTLTNEVHDRWAKENGLL